MRWGPSLLESQDADRGDDVGRGGWIMVVGYGRFLC